MMKLLFRVLSTIIAIAVLTVIAFFIYLYSTQYKPSETQLVHIRNPQNQSLIPNQDYTITTLNIGHGSSGSTSQMNTSTSLTSDSTATQIEEHLEAIAKQLLNLNSDFYTLQDVDQQAKRSHYINQSEKIASFFDNHSAAFAYTFNASYIPIPIRDPIGQLESGLLTLSRFSTEEDRRLALPSSDVGVVKKLTAQRYAILETTLPVRGNRALVIVNLQLAHFDADERLNEKHFEFIEQYIEEHLENQDYLILSGDWSHLLASPAFKLVESWPLHIAKLPDTFKPSGMSWAIDHESPTSRSMAAPYQQDISFVSITDGFLVSNNIEIISTKTTYTQFNHSSHQPVTLTFRLK